MVSDGAVSGTLFPRSIDKVMYRPLFVSGYKVVCDYVEPFFIECNKKLNR